MALELISRLSAALLPVKVPDRFVPRQSPLQDDEGGQNDIDNILAKVDDIPRQHLVIVISLT